MLRRSCQKKIKLNEPNKRNKQYKLTFGGSGNLDKLDTVGLTFGNFLALLFRRLNIILFLSGQSVDG